MKLFAALLVNAALFTLLSTASSAQVGGFSDVPKDHWAAQSVAKLAQAGIIVGEQGSGGKPTVKSAKPVTKSAYNGEKPVTRYELAVTLYRFVQYIERANTQKKSKMGVQADPMPTTGADALRLLIAGGYIKADAPFAKNGTKLVTANELATVLADVITRCREKQSPMSPDSKNFIAKPGANPGT